jgi:hypothetical protein
MLKSWFSLTSPSISSEAFWLATQGRSDIPERPCVGLATTGGELLKTADYVAISLSNLEFIHFC